MMLSPNCFVLQYEGENFAELIKTRNSLMRDIEYLEKVLLYPAKYSDCYTMLPSPSTQYKVSLEYLVALCEYMGKAYIREFEGQDNFDDGYIEDCGGISPIDVMVKK